jgi:hypothetical protein
MLIANEKAKQIVMRKVPTPGKKISLKFQEETRKPTVPKREGQDFDAL